MGEIRDFKELVVWQRSMELSGVCFQIVQSTARARTRGIASQLLEAADSVHSNIAEGHGRPTRKDYLRFVGTAHASLREVESHLLDLEQNRGVRGAGMDRALALADECGRMLTILRRRLREG